MKKNIILFTIIFISKFCTAQIETGVWDKSRLIIPFKNYIFYCDEKYLYVVNTISYAIGIIRKKEYDKLDAYDVVGDKIYFALNNYGTVTVIETDGLPNNTKEIFSEKIKNPEVDLTLKGDKIYTINKEKNTLTIYSKNDPVIKQLGGSRLVKVKQYIGEEKEVTISEKVNKIIKTDKNIYLVTKTKDQCFLWQINQVDDGLIYIDAIANSEGFYAETVFSIAAPNGFYLFPKYSEGELSSYFKGLVRGLYMYYYKEGNIEEKNNAIERHEIRITDEKNRKVYSPQLRFLGLFSGHGVFGEPGNYKYLRDFGNNFYPYSPIYDLSNIDYIDEVVNSQIYSTDGYKTPYTYNIAIKNDSVYQIVKKKDTSFLTIKKLGTYGDGKIVQVLDTTNSKLRNVNNIKYSLAYNDKVYALIYNSVLSETYLWDITVNVVYLPTEDADKDGIINILDKCPTIAGTAEFNGCPMPVKIISKPLPKTNSKESKPTTQVIKKSNEKLLPNKPLKNKKLIKLNLHENHSYYLLNFFAANIKCTSKIRTGRLCIYRGI